MKSFCKRYGYSIVFLLAIFASTIGARGAHAQMLISPKAITNGTFTPQAPAGYVSPQERVRQVSAPAVVGDPQVPYMKDTEKLPYLKAVNTSTGVVLAQTAKSADPQHVEFKLPPEAPAGSLAAQLARQKYDAEEGVGCSVHTKCVPAAGRTADGKYPLYVLEGDLDDLNYVSVRTNIIYQPRDLLRRMVFLAETDAKSNQYQCGFVCKDAKARIVGLNPQVRWMLNPPAAGSTKTVNKK